MGDLAGGGNALTIEAKNLINSLPVAMRLSIEYVGQKIFDQQKSQHKVVLKGQLERNIDGLQRLLNYFKSIQNFNPNVMKVHEILVLQIREFNWMRKNQKSMQDLKESAGIV